MKKSTFALCAVLCAGLAPISSHAQTVQPTTYETAFAAGKRDFKAENYEAATKDAAESLAVAASPEEIGDALTLLGESYYRRKMWVEADAQWAKLLEIQGIDENEDMPQFAAHFGRARTCVAQSQFDKAIPEYQAAIAQLREHGGEGRTDVELKQTLAPFTYALASAYYGDGQLDLARQQLTEIIQYSDGDSPFRLLALLTAGQIDTDQRQYKKALDEFLQVLALRESQAAQDGEGANLKRIRSLIPLLESLVKSGAGAGEPKDYRISVDHDKEIDQGINTVTALVMDALGGTIATDSFDDDDADEQPK